eukprot:COSAG02_NODE_9366_length_2240_cov_0.993461_3_plen_44_part_00
MATAESTGLTDRQAVVFLAATECAGVLTGVFAWAFASFTWDKS